MSLLESIQQTMQEQEEQATAQQVLQEEDYNSKCCDIQYVIYKLIHNYIHSGIFAMETSNKPYNSYNAYNSQVKLTDLSVGDYSIILSAEVSHQAKYESEEEFTALVVAALYINVYRNEECYTNNPLDASPSDLGSTEAFKKKLTSKLAWAIDKAEELYQKDLKKAEARAKSNAVQAEIDEAEKNLLRISLDTVKYISELYEKKCSALKDNRKVKLYLWEYRIGENIVEVWSFTDPISSIIEDQLYRKIQRVTDSNWIYIPVKSLSVVNEIVYQGQYPRSLMQSITVLLDEEFYMCKAMRSYTDGTVQDRYCADELTYDSPYVEDYLFYASQPIETGFHTWEKWAQDGKYVVQIPVDSIQQLSEGSPNLVA